MFRTSATRGKAMLIATFATLLLLGAVYATIVIQDRDEVRLGFGPRDGFGTASSHGGFAGDLLGIVVDTVDAYETMVQSLDVYQPLTPLGGDVKTDLLSARAYVQPDDTYEVRVTVPPALDLQIQGNLEELPPGDVSDTLRTLEAEGWKLLDDASGSVPTAPPGGLDEPFVFEASDGEHTYATIVVHPDAAAVELIVHPAGAFKGLHIVSTPWVVEVRDDGEAIVDLWVRNPVTSFYAGAAEEVVVKNVVCKNGKCLPQGVVRNTCKSAGACPAEYRVSAEYESGPHPMPGTLLHLWANDTIHGGAGMEILGETVSLAVPVWHGSPFADEGLYVQDAKGNKLVGVALSLPSSTSPSVGINVTGAVVPDLAGEGVELKKDLSAWQVHVRLGDHTIGTDNVYPVLDMASAVVVQAWTEADGDVKAASVGTLRERGGLIRLVEEKDGDVRALIEGLGVEVEFPNSEFEPLLGPLLGPIGALTGPAEEAVVKIKDRTEEEVWAQVRVVEGAAGCEVTTLGCLQFVIGAVEDAVGGVDVPGTPEVPDPEILVGALPTSGDEVVLFVNTLAGQVLGYVPLPGAPEEVCTPGLPGAPPVCSTEAPSAEDVLAVVTGLLGEPLGALTAFVEDPENGSISLTDRNGNTLLHVDGGSVKVAGLGASLGEGGLFTIYGPGGAETCVRTTTAPGAPGVPGIEVGCDGVAGQMLVVEPGVDYAVEDGRLAYAAIRDPTTGGTLLEYADDGAVVRLTVRSPVMEQSIQLPSESVAVIGNPLTSSTFTIRLAGHAVPLGSHFSEVKVLRQAYDQARAVASGLPVGSEVGMLFRLVEAPQADVRVTDGFAHLVGAQGELTGGDWLSGLRDNAFRVTTQVEAHTPDRLDVVYEVGALPSYGASPSAHLPVSGVSSNQTTRIHEGAVPSAGLREATEGAVMHFGLAWVERVGPAAVVLWDDNGGQGYRYSLDTRAPAAGLSAPATSGDAVFAIAWSSTGDAGSGMGHFRVQSAVGGSPAADAWVDWIGKRPAGEPAFADFNGEPGQTYAFRAAACDAVGNCGPWSATRTVEVVAAAPPQPAAPAVQIIAPLPGASLSGVSELAWKVTYDGNATPIVNVAYQQAGGDAWVPLYSGSAQTATWRTDVLVDGTYTLRFVVTDGTYSTTKSVSVRLANGVTEANLDSVRAANDADAGEPSADAPSAPSDASSPSWLVPVLSVGTVLVIGGAVAGVLLGRRRRAA